MESAFKKIEEEFDQINEHLELASRGQLSGVDIGKLAKRRSELEPVYLKILLTRKFQKELENNQKLLDDPNSEIKSMALDECRRLELEILNLKSKIEEALLPKDPNDERNCIVEIRAGAGGDESTLFAAEMFRTYGKFAEGLGFRTHVVSSSRSEAGGFKEVIFEIVGAASGRPQIKAGNTRPYVGPYSVFKYESGVHRVQRVPETEKSGRVHTSTITVAVLPELAEQDYQIDPKDLKIEATTSSGHGGQSVNTTYSAIRILHIPTGITAQCQDERSQNQNKEKAMAVIRARVADYYQLIEDKKLKATRKSQIGTGDRSEKIRTYNFPQDRVTDHRINQNFNQINLIMEGKLDGIVSALQKADLEAKKVNLKI